jgi:hypothetical protein
MEWRMPSGNENHLKMDFSTSVEVGFVVAANRKMLRAAIAQCGVASIQDADHLPARCVQRGEVDSPKWSSISRPLLFDNRQLDDT